MTSIFAHLSLRTKLWLGLGGLFLILLLGSGISAIVLTHFSRELQRLLRENYDSALYCEEMADALDRLDASARQLAWQEAGAPVDAEAQQGRFEENLARQVHNVSLPGEPQATSQLVDQWRAYRRAYGYMQTARASERRELYVKSLAPTCRAARASAQTIRALNMNNVIAADGRVRATTLRVRNALLILVGAGAAVAIVIVAAAGATVLNPLRDLTLSVVRVGAGDLDLTVQVKSNDEVGQLAAAFNVMAERLREYRKVDHQRLLRAQQTTQLAIDSLPDAVIVTSPRGVIEICNRTAMTHFHADPGRNISELGLDWLIALHRYALSGKEVEPRGYASAVQLFQKGEEKFLLPRGVPMMHGDDMVGVAIILVDVTRLRQADEFKSGLVSTVSHELRTPLTSIRMSTILLAEQTLGALNPNQKRLIDAARDESERLHRIIENLLNFSRSQAGAAKLRPHAVAARELIADALTPLAPGFAERNIQIRIDADGAPDAWADPALAASVLTNLLSNAMKFTPINGWVDIRAAAAGDMLEISVADTGPGVAPEHVGSLFQRFFRAAGANAPAGTGLGLAISREIAIAHGGSVAYAPRPTGGSVFLFKLPTALLSLKRR